MVVFEDILDDVGGAGKYQYLQCLPLMLVLPAMSWHLLGNSFMFATPDKRCEISPIAPCNSFIDNKVYNQTNGYSIGDQDQMYRYILFPDTSDKPNGYCTYRKFQDPAGLCNAVEDLKISPSSFIWNETKTDYWTMPNETITNKLDQIIGQYKFNDTKCSVWSYSDQYYDITGVTEFDWVCDQNKYPENLQIAVMIGVFWGSPLFGWTSDNFGRKITLCICFILSFLSTILVRFVSGPNSFTWLCVLRMIDGAGAIGGIAAAFVLISEVFESKGYAKILVLQIGQSLFGVGQAVLAGIVSKYSEWRLLSTIIAMPMLMAILIWFFNDESARWLITRGRFEEADFILKKIAKVNGREVKKRYVFEEDVKNNNSEDDGIAPSETILNAMKKSRIRRIILNLCYQWFMLSGIYYALAVKAATFGSNPFISYTISGFLEVPACFGTLLMYQFFGRRPSTFFLECFAGITLVMIMFTPSSNEALMSTLPQLGKFFLTAVYGGIYVYTAEMLPTSIKNSGIGICSSIARIGGVASQIIEMVPKMCKQDATLDCTKIPYAIYGVMTLLGCILMFGLPETKDESSPDNIDQGNEFGKNQPGLLLQMVGLCSKRRREYETPGESSEKQILRNSEDEVICRSLSEDDNLPETHL